MHYEVKTTITGAMIVQDIDLVNADGRESVRRQIMDALDGQVIDALEKMGWRMVGASEAGAAPAAVEQAAGVRAMLAPVSEVETLRRVMQQVLTDAEAQGVLPEWWTLMRDALMPNVKITGGRRPSGGAQGSGSTGE